MDEGRMGGRGEDGTHIVKGALPFLVVDDRPLVVRAMLRPMAMMGYAGISAESVEEACSLIDDCDGLMTLVLDAFIPLRDGESEWKLLDGKPGGFRVFAHARARWPDIEALMISGHDIPQEFALLPGLEFVWKPAAAEAIRSFLLCRANRLGNVGDSEVRGG